MATQEVIPVQEVKEHKTKVQNIMEQMQAIKVTSQDELTSVAEHIGVIKQAKKVVTEARDKYIAPAKEIIDRAKADFNPIIDMCDEAEKILKGKAQAFMEAEDKRIEDAKKKEVAKVESGYQKPETAVEKISQMPTAVKTTKSAAGTLGIKKVKEVVIVDESKIPEEYYKPRELDMVKIKKVATAGIAIPGVEVKEVSQMQHRAK